MGLFGGSDINLPDPEKEVLSEDENRVLDKLAQKTVERGMSVPAIIFLESIKPLNFIMSQMLVFFEPIVQTIFNFRDYDHYRSALEKRETPEILLLKIEKYDAVALEKERCIKKFMKTEKKNWKWYQRYLGIFRPKVVIPEEIINPPKKADSTEESK